MDDSASGHDKARQALGKSRAVVEDLLRERCERGMSTQPEELALAKLDASYLWVATEAIGMATEERSRR